MRMTLSLLGTWVGFTLVLLGSTSAPNAQDAVIEGWVVDQQDSALVGVTVELNAPALPGPVVVTTDPRGAYRFAALSPGVYTLSFTLSGFGFAQRDVTLGAGAVRTDRVVLFLRVDNLLDTKYETFGVLAEIEIELDEVPDAADPRFVSPGAPRSAFAGVRFQF